VNRTQPEFVTEGLHKQALSCGWRRAGFLGVGKLRNIFIKRIWQSSPFSSVFPCVHPFVVQLEDSRVTAHHSGLSVFLWLVLFSPSHGGTKISIQEGRRSESGQGLCGCCTVQVRLYCTRPCQEEVRGKTLTDVSSLLAALPPFSSSSPTVGLKRCYPRNGTLASYFWEMWICLVVQGQGTLPSISITCAWTVGVCISRESDLLLELSLSGPRFLCPLVLFPLLQTRSCMATQEINLLIDLSEGLGM